MYPTVKEAHCITLPYGGKGLCHNFATPNHFVVTTKICLNHYLMVLLQGEEDDTGPSKKDLQQENLELRAANKELCRLLKEKILQQGTTHDKGKR